MQISETSFKNKQELLEWHKTNFPQSYESYMVAISEFKKLGFSGSVKLLKNLGNNEKTSEFMSFLTEFNLANLLISKHVSDLAYESLSGADFVFDNIALSIKNLHCKKYEKSEQEKINQLKSEGGGSINLTHKKFSDINIKVEKTDMGTYGWERTETGHNGFLDSDLFEMSKPLKYIGEFEKQETGNLKKVLFFFIHSGEFVDYYIKDIAIWYFEYKTNGYPPIFQNDMSWYYKLLGKDLKKNNIDALIFMYSPNTLLTWPDNCLKDVSGDKSRIQIYTKDKNLFNNLKLLFS